MNKKHSLIGFTVLACSIISLHASSAFRDFQSQQTLFMGTIQWPTALKKVPSLRMYHAGHQLSGETNHETHQITYAVPEMRDISIITLIIAEPQNIKLQMAEDNTIQHLTIIKDTPHKCYQITRTHADPTSIAVNPTSKTTPTDSWRVEQRRLHDDGTIPDNALIVCCNPDLIGDISGGNSIDLPTIHIVSDVLTKMGSEEALHEAADTFLITCLNLDTLHTKLTFDVKQHQEKKLVAFNIM
jgi:hypothetical protein